MGVAQGDGWQNACAVAATGRGVVTIDDFTSASASASFIAIFLRADIHLPAAQVAVKDNNIAKPATTRRCNQFLHPTSPYNLYSETNFCVIFGLVLQVKNF